MKRLTGMISNLLLVNMILLSSIILLLSGCKKESKPPVIDEPHISMPADGMLAYYPFNIDVKDSTSQGNNGTLMGNAQIAPTGKVGGALKLDGTEDYVSINKGLNLTNEFSMSCWINPVTVTRSDAAIFAKYQTRNYGPYDFYLLYDKLAFWISDGRGNFKIIKSNTAIAAKAWTHVAWVAKNNSLRMYINGVLETGVDGVIPNMTSNNDLVTIGRQALYFTASGDLEFEGMIDELRLYQRELTQNEIKLLSTQAK